MSLTLRIKFPPTYPLIYKTLRIDPKLTVKQAITYIGETLNVACGGNIGLFLPLEKRWLDDNTPLSTYDGLQDAEEIEFRDRDAPTGGCCILI